MNPNDARALSESLEQTAVVTGRLTHDFGNYLTGIMGFAELSASQAAPEGLLNRYILEVLQAARSGAAWVRRLHLFCRRGQTAPWPTALAYMIADEEARLRSGGAAALGWQADLPGDLPLADIDAEALQTIVGELVDNARQACGDGGTIRLTARPCQLDAAAGAALLGEVQPGPHLELRISDDGPGISPGDQARLFRELFFSTKPRHRGLGLLVVYGILRRYRGGLSLTSAPGQGTTVCVYVPAVAVGPTLEQAAGTRVLVAHADTHLAESMRRILESERCQVDVAATASQALNTYSAAAKAPALVVIDMQLPPRSGFDLARRLLDTDANAKLMFVHTQAAFHGPREDELLNRFPWLRWPQTRQSFLDAVAATITPKDI